jgi:hypothetical protein
MAGNIFSDYEFGGRGMHSRGGQGNVGMDSDGGHGNRGMHSSGG